MIAHQRPITVLGVDAEAAPQIEHVVRDFERAARLEYDAATEILAPVSSSRTNRLLTLMAFVLARAFFAPLDLFEDNQIGKHLVEVSVVHEIEVITNDAQRPRSCCRI